MGRKARNQLLDTSLGQHLALSVAAHLARSQLLPDPLRAYDAQHLTSVLDAIGTALARVAPVYARDVSGTDYRALDQGELEGAMVRRGATVLHLKDGRVLSGVSIKRVDLRQAIAVLKTVGIPDMPGVVRDASEPDKRAAVEDPMPRLRAQLSEMEALLRPPLIPSQAERANSIAISIARHAPHGQIANHAMRLMSAVAAASSGGQGESQIQLALARLQAAMHATSADISASGPGTEPSSDSGAVASPPKRRVGSTEMDNAA